MRWDEFAAAAPELARLGEERLRSRELCLVGTLRRNGWPRISPVEPEFVEGELMLGMMWRSPKALDLLRDPRVYVHLPVTAKSGDPEVKLAGRAEVVADAALAQTLSDLFWSRIQWRPAADSHTFELRFDRGAYVTYDNGQHAVRWDVVRGARRSFREGI